MNIKQTLPDELNPSPEPWLVDWLSCETSLTEKLFKLAGDARVELLRMAWETAAPWEKKHFEISESRLLKREVLITAHQKPCWYARTFIPESCFQLEPEFFQQLNHQPLSELIYSQEKVRRQALIYYPVLEGSVERSWLDDHSAEAVDGGVWARLASFRFKNQASFFLCELLFEQQLASMLAFSRQGD